MSLFELMSQSARKTGDRQGEFGRVNRLREIHALPLVFANAPSSALANQLVAILVRQPDVADEYIGFKSLNDR